MLLFSYAMMYASLMYMTMSCLDYNQHALCCTVRISIGLWQICCNYLVLHY